MNILIVDDDPVSRRLLREIVATAPGHHLSEAASGKEAWELLDNPSRFFDLVFLDLAMPGLDGFEILGRIHDSQILRSTRVVMCTAASDRETVAKVIRLGARHYLVKPATQAVVHAKLKQLEAEIAADAQIRHRFSGAMSA
jgi:CheY-like chemotaxis protein